MASDGNDNYTECILKIDTSEGWEKSVTKVLTSFQDLAYEINPSIGFIYVKGKTNPQIILMNILKGGKHATIHWISYGLPKDDQNQFQDPYEAYNRFYHPYYPWYNTDQQLPQSGLLQGQLKHEPSRHSSEKRSTSSCSSHHHHHHCPVHSHHNHSPVSSSQSRHTPAQNPSPPSVQPEANNDQGSNNQPVCKKSSGKSIKKIIGRLSLWLRS